MVTIYLIRHGHAGSRKAWKGPDEQRPLSAKGLGQAAAIAERFGDAEIDQILSSPSLRCRQTVEPLAHRAGRELRVEPALAEGTPGEVTLALLHGIIAAGGSVALCSHGDVIPELMAELRSDGLEADGHHSSAKGGTFLLETDEGRLTAARYVPPPPVGALTAD